MYFHKIIFQLSLSKLIKIRIENITSTWCYFTDQQINIIHETLVQLITKLEPIANKLVEYLYTKSNNNNYTAQFKSIQTKMRKIIPILSIETNTTSINYKRTIIEEFTQMQNQQSCTRPLKFIWKKKRCWSSNS